MADYTVFVKHPELGVGTLDGDGPWKGYVVVEWLDGTKSRVKRDTLKFKKVKTKKGKK